MVDTTDSKSVASNRVRVQVSSPVIQGLPSNGSFFLFNGSLVLHLFIKLRKHVVADLMIFDCFPHVTGLNDFRHFKVGNCSGNFYTARYCAGRKTVAVYSGCEDFLAFFILNAVKGRFFRQQNHRQHV